MKLDDVSTIILEFLACSHAITLLKNYTGVPSLKYVCSYQTSVSYQIHYMLIDINPGGQLENNHLSGYLPMDLLILLYSAGATDRLIFSGKVSI